MSVLYPLFLLSRTNMFCPSSLLSFVIPISILYFCLYRRVCSLEQENDLNFTFKTSYGVTTPKDANVLGNPPPIETVTSASTQGNDGDRNKAIRNPVRGTKNPGIGKCSIDSSSNKKCVTGKIEGAGGSGTTGNKKKTQQQQQQQQRRRQQQQQDGHCRNCGRLAVANAGLQRLLRSCSP